MLLMFEQLLQCSIHIHTHLHKWAFLGPYNVQIPIVQSSCDAHWETLMTTVKPFKEKHSTII